MFGFLKRLFGKEPAPAKDAELPVNEFNEEEYERDYEAKKAGLEQLLGPLHELVGHAIIPYAIGGAVDMYYFAEGIPGTAFATMEIAGPDGSGPKPNRIGTYELVAFTKHRCDAVSGNMAEDPSLFRKIERRMCGLFTSTGRYSEMAVLNPGETCEIPYDDDEPPACVVLDEYTKDGQGFTVAGERRCLLLLIEVHRDEMEFARSNGSAALLEKLKSAGHYPYSDLDRASVV